ncbi:helix-turn-helix transcriptional regulator [Paenibacillus segetis]|uniref:Transcriptional regulator n=1 Tax=Paenibacillus segetis TaxID=1325360 RepID=A0ABQ1YVG9_9BACL|nr:WYL domain-containing protein [Paenibacillus segetis]GGH39236.1 transcriptional regulator [Paenibacillus segetis]
MRADRLLTILLLLQNGGKMTSRSLAEQLEVSNRTIIRDMEALCAAGLPIYAERGANGGWVLDEKYRTNLTGMTPEEIVSLLISSHDSLLRDLGIKRHFDAAYQKLLTSSPVTIQQDAEIIRQRIHVDGLSWHPSDESFPYLSVIQEAVWSDRQLFIRYQKEHEQVERVVHPLGLVAKRKVWYLVADTNQELRTYRISRLLDAQLLMDTFQRPASFNLAQYWEQSTEQFKARLPRYPALVRLTEQQLSRIQRDRYVKILHFEFEEDGWRKAQVEFHTLESACQLVLSCGQEMVVLEPSELRDKVILEAKAICAIYQSNL